MASFDLETFLKVQGETGVTAFGAAGMAFGLPSCALFLGQQILNILPSSVLADVRANIISAKSLANNATREVFKKLMLDTGIIEFDTDQGIFIFKSPFSTTDNDGLQGFQNLAGILGALQFASSFGAQIYQNYTNITNEIDAAIDCLNKIKDVKAYQPGNSAEQKLALTQQQAEDLLDTKFAAEKAALETTNEFIDDCNNQILRIDTILAQRAADDTLEPCLLDSAELDQFLGSTTFKRCPVDDPGLEEEDVFRLTYGPPVTKEGQYVLTSDGLYYDSQSGGLDPIYLSISGIIAPGDKWKYDYDPNLGGKGTTISIASLNKFTDNIFDTAIIDDSKGLKMYYDADHFLSVIKQQRDKHVYDLSGDLQGFITEYGEGSSIVKNQRNLIISEIANHNHKINRRKKQIEVALKAPQIYGDGDGPMFAPGEIPINDFSFLEKYNLQVDLEKQKALVFAEGEVDGMVLPIDPKFVKSSSKSPSIGFAHLSVPTVGKGSIIYTPSGGATPSGTVLSLTDQIVDEDLFAIYNFLDTTLSLPSSTDFHTTNCATQGVYNNAQLVGTNQQSIFFSGLAIPYLEGVVKNKSSDSAGASALGSFLRLPDNPEYRDLTYNHKGFTVDCWVHVPNIKDEELGWLSTSTSSLTKVLFGCENTGNTSGVSAIDHTATLRGLDFLENKKGTDYTRGLICGFSRDRRITQTSSTASNSNGDNLTSSSLSFFLAPTQARDSSSLSWINNDECQDFASFFKMKVDLSSNHSLGSVDSNFVHLAIAVNPQEDEVVMYIDGQVLATSALTTVFGEAKYAPPSLPSFKKPNSFEYSLSTVDGPLTVKTGPKLNPFYTPWLVGGGWTDGMYQYGNFMGGGSTGGVISGLRGHVGSLKFYSRALDSREVLTNYEAQQGFFKQIIT